MAAVIIAVDDPDKRGYALFNKAKKGAAANVPVVLATSTILPEVFSGHRKLKVHADEYLDKRTLSRPELIGKLDNLLGLGEIIASSPAMALLVDDDYLVDDDVLVDEVDSAELDLGAIDDLIVDERMVSDNDLLLGDLDAEADAAFAMLTDGVEDSGSQPALEPEPEPEVVPVAPLTPVVPVAHNAGKLWGRNAFLKYPGVITMSIGFPINPQGLGAEELNQRVEAWIENEMQRLP